VITIYLGVILMHPDMIFMLFVLRHDASKQEWSIVGQRLATKLTHVPAATDKLGKVYR
jgi:hypothetical protein